MFQFEEEADLVQDREDIIKILHMRFGTVAPEVIEKIYDITSMDTMERLILVAANSDKLATFKEELHEGEGTFKIVGERFNPARQLTEREDAHGEK